MAITLVGHSCLDQIEQNGRVVQTRAGGVPIYGLPVLLSMDRRCVTYTKYNPQDVMITEALSSGGADIVQLPAQQSTVFTFDTVDGVVGEPSAHRQSEPITADELDLSRSEVLYFAPLLPSDIDTECFKAAREAGKRVVVDAQGLTRQVPDTSHREAAFSKLAFAHVVKVTNAEAVWLSGSDQPALVQAAFKQLGVEEVVMTSGAEGSWIIHGDEIVFIPAEPCTSALDTVGSGDIYFSVYMHARLEGHTPIAAGRKATAYVAKRLRESL